MLQSPRAQQAEGVVKVVVNVKSLTEHRVLSSLTVVCVCVPALVAKCLPC